jgi:hypothetical protein
MTRLVDRRIILKQILNKLGRWASVDWIHLSQDKDWWQALVDTVMNL